MEPLLLLSLQTEHPRHAASQSRRPHLHREQRCRGLVSTQGTHQRRQIQSLKHCKCHLRRSNEMPQWSKRTCCCLICFILDYFCGGYLLLVILAKFLKSVSGVQHFIIFTDFKCNTMNMLPFYLHYMFLGGTWGAEMSCRHNYFNFYVDVANSLSQERDKKKKRLLGAE